MKNNNIINSYQEELTKLEQKEKKKIEKFKRKEERKKIKQEKRLERLEDKIFANRQKFFNQNDNKTSILTLSNIYKVALGTTLISSIGYFLYSLIKKQTPVINTILFTLIVIGFLLTSTIQKKKERKFISIITSILFIIWMLLNM